MKPRQFTVNVIMVRGECPVNIFFHVIKMCPSLMAFPVHVRIVYPACDVLKASLHGKDASQQWKRLSKLASSKCSPWSLPSVARQIVFA